MPKRKVLYAVFLVTSFLASTPCAHADLIHWHYEFTRTPDFLPSDPAGPNSAGTGTISFFPATAGEIDNSSSIVAFNMATSSSAPDGNGNPDRYTNKSYALTLSIKDDASGDTGSLNFGGAISGTVTTTNTNLTNVFTNPLIQDLTLGGNLYVVQIGPFTAPAPPGSENFGAVGLHVDVSKIIVDDPGPIAKVPEPSSLLLAALGCLGGGTLWRRRRAGRA